MLEYFQSHCIELQLIWNIHPNKMELLNASIAIYTQLCGLLVFNPKYYFTFRMNVS